MLSNTTLTEGEIIPVPKKSVYSLYVKRILDIALSGFALIVLFPVFVIIAVLELIFHGRPILYVSQRPGKNCEIFNIYKFRSMTNETDENGDLLPEEFRLTKFGVFLRRTSLDELPELRSVFVGKMSIVGPRPLLTEYIDLYTPRHKMRHSVLPGLACVRIKRSKDDVVPNCLTWRNQFENDIYYIENISFVLDVKMIIGIALEAVKGSSYRTNDTRVRFNGKNLDDTRSKQEALSGSENEVKKVIANVG